MYFIPMEAPGKLAIVPRPRGGDWLEDDLAALRRQGIDVLVSLLTSAETEEIGLAKEEGAARAAGLLFRSFPVVDRSVPGDRSAFTGLAAELLAHLQAGQSVAVHCRMGIGRASLLAASVLTAAGVAPGAAWERVQEARGTAVPDTDAQRAWLWVPSQTDPDLPW